MASPLLEVHLVVRRGDGREFAISDPEDWPRKLRILNADPSAGTAFLRCLRSTGDLFEVYNPVLIAWFTSERVRIERELSSLGRPVPAE